MVIKFLKKYFFLILALLLIVGGYVFLTAVGQEYTLTLPDYTGASGITDVYIDTDSIGDAEITGWYTTEHGLMVNLKSVSIGRFYLIIQCENSMGIRVLYVHQNGVITNDLFFGDCTGSIVIILAILLYFLLLAAYFIIKCRHKIRQSLYSYDNVLYLGLVIFSVFFAVTLIPSLYYRDGISGALYRATGSTQTFVLFTLPVVILVTISVTISNIKLIKREGRTWKNMLGFILGLCLGLGAVLPVIISVLFQHSTVIDVHYEKGIGRFIEMFIKYMISSIVTYLECILIGTIINGIATAIHIPKFDKDYILILGCQIKKNGSLTKLLQSRTNRAVAFAKMQKDATGKDIIFVPTGGKGSDEIISEGEAIKRYLMKFGIKEDRILAETESRNTEQNFRYSVAKIRKHHGSDDFKIAFSTNNYHVFRSGMLAESLGIKAEGIGSRTKSYFWINAFVREFIATIVKEKRTHIKVTAILFLINLTSIAMMYISEVVLA